MPVEVELLVYCLHFPLKIKSVKTEQFVRFRSFCKFNFVEFVKAFLPGVIEVACSRDKTGALL
jgi:hypothetical protein